MNLKLEQNIYSKEIVSLLIYFLIPFPVCSLHLGQRAQRSVSLVFIFAILPSLTSFVIHSLLYASQYNFFSSSMVSIHIFPLQSKHQYHPFQQRTFSFNDHHQHFTILFISTLCFHKSLITTTICYKQMELVAISEVKSEEMVGDDDCANSELTN